MSSYKSVDSKREEFRKYLEKTGALDVLVKVLVVLYEESDKPTDALDFIRRGLGDNRSDDAELEILKTDLESAMLKIQTLQNENNVLKEKIAQFENVEGTEIKDDLCEDASGMPATSSPWEATTNMATSSGENLPPAQ